MRSRSPPRFFGFHVPTDMDVPSVAPLFQARLLSPIASRFRSRRRSAQRGRQHAQTFTELLYGDVLGRSSRALGETIYDWKVAWSCGPVMDPLGLCDLRQPSHCQRESVDGQDLYRFPRL